MSLLQNREPEHVRPRIVAAGVALHAAGRDLLHVQHGVEHAFLVSQGIGDRVAEGVDDIAAAPAGDVGELCDLVLGVEIFGVGVPGKDHVAVDEVAVPDRKSTRLNSSHPTTSRMPSSA